MLYVVCVWCLGHMCVWFVCSLWCVTCGVCGVVCVCEVCGVCA